MMVAAGDVTTAALVTSAVQVWRARMGAPVPPYRVETVGAVVAATRDALGDAAFVIARREGEELAPELAIFKALGVTARDVRL